MKIIKKYLLSVLFIGCPIINGQNLTQNWIEENYVHYKLVYQEFDKYGKDEYIALINSGIYSVQNFFKDAFKMEFDIYVHPSRQSLDKQWQEDWNMPEFSSECWMVASGVAERLDLLSPIIWATESCEHDYSNKFKTQQLFTHELVHIYHGQKNVSPDFSDVTDIDWFIEGLATYASGQLDSLRIDEVKQEILNDKAPDSLNLFWSGKLRYARSGSIVMYIDYKYGIDKLKSLLKFSNKADIIRELDMTEANLIANWKDFMLAYELSK